VNFKVQGLSIGFNSTCSIFLLNEIFSRGTGDDLVLISDTFLDCPNINCSLFSFSGEIKSCLSTSLFGVEN